MAESEPPSPPRPGSSKSEFKYKDSSNRKTTRFHPYGDDKPPSCSFDVSVPKRSTPSQSAVAIDLLGMSSEIRVTSPDCPTMEDLDIIERLAEEARRKSKECSDTKDEDNPQRSLETPPLKRIKVDPIFEQQKPALGAVSQAKSDDKDEENNRDNHKIPNMDKIEPDAQEVLGITDEGPAIEDNPTISPPTKGIKVEPIFEQQKPALGEGEDKHEEEHIRDDPTMEDKDKIDRDKYQCKSLANKQVENIGLDHPSIIIRDVSFGESCVDVESDVLDRTPELVANFTSEDSDKNVEAIELPKLFNEYSHLLDKESSDIEEPVQDFSLSENRVDKQRLPIRSSEPLQDLEEKSRESVREATSSDASVKKIYDSALEDSKMNVETAGPPSPEKSQSMIGDCSKSGESLASVKPPRIQNVVKGIMLVNEGGALIVKKGEVTMANYITCSLGEGNVEPGLRDDLHISTEILPKSTPSSERSQDSDQILPEPEEQHEVDSTPCPEDHLYYDYPGCYSEGQNCSDEVAEDFQDMEIPRNVAELQENHGNIPNENATSDDESMKNPEHSEPGISFGSKMLRAVKGVKRAIDNIVPRRRGNVQEDHGNIPNPDATSDDDSMKISQNIAEVQGDHGNIPNQHTTSDDHSRKIPQSSEGRASPTLTERIIEEVIAAFNSVIPRRQNVHEDHGNIPNRDATGRINLDIPQSIGEVQGDHENSPNQDVSSDDEYDEA